MRALLRDLGDPQKSFRAVHVVGTNGKSTATRTIEELLRADGLRVGAYLSPHVRAWSERIRIDGTEADFEGSVEGVRAAAERANATQFETLTAAAFAEFAEREKGMLARGMLADFVLLDRDLTRIPPEDIRDVRVLLTVIGGRPVYERTEANGR